MNPVHVTGTVDAEGGFTPGWWGGAPPGAIRPDGAGSGWTVVALDETGRAVARVGAAIVTVPVCPGEPYRQLEAVLDLPESAAAVTVLDGGREVFRRPVPAPPAGIRVEQRDGEALVHVDGPRPPPGAHLVARWESGGRRPPVPAGDIVDVGAGARSALSMDPGELPGGREYRLRVDYSDGIRTVTALSEPVTVPARPPNPVIEAPATGLEMFDDGWLGLDGRLGGDGDPGSLTWLLDDEPVGTGPHLRVVRPPSGTHVLTLRYGDDADSRQLTVHQAPVAEVPERGWSPPWRTAPYRVVGVAARAGQQGTG
ncbi:hypothetical protein E1264_16085 [Actinomadura sp. KC216]|uniref:hypothetical protein n=1 Tax=Actinomadura sp. KC216 TaxID=2530370 RepID=UPI0010469CD3|nr:hypothetical protein [Actinomadura sp. KC216]TDB86982.1 hypothetical protein E1264_16085 [Actinomadura sp. KC216]